MFSLRDVLPVGIVNWRDCHSISKGVLKLRELAGTPTPTRRHDEFNKLPFSLGLRE